MFDFKENRLENDFFLYSKMMNCDNQNAISHNSSQILLFELSFWERQTTNSYHRNLMTASHNSWRVLNCDVVWICCYGCFGFAYNKLLIVKSVVWPLFGVFFFVFASFLRFFANCDVAKSRIVTFLTYQNTSHYKYMTIFSIHFNDSIALLFRYLLL